MSKQVIEKDYRIYNGDCCTVMDKVDDQSVDYTIFSPPFADLYCYSDNPADMGNCAGYDEFFQHFGFLIQHLSRVTKPGRLVSIHCIDIPAMKERDGYIGLKDFPGEIVRAFQSAGFIYHSKHTIWKDPLTEATRTKAIGLMHKQLQKDSAMSRAGLPDYLVTMRAPGENKVPIAHPEGLTRYAGSQDPGGSGIKRSHNIWRAYASPVWMDIRQTHTLNTRIARESEDEKHLCPLQLDTIDRGLTLWSNPGETILTPFMGVGSEVYCAVGMGRRGIGIELKKSYFDQAVRNIANASRTVDSDDLFSGSDDESMD